eukprot:2805583-Rhodomonas_salina.1
MQISRGLPVVVQREESTEGCAAARDQCLSAACAVPDGTTRRAIALISHRTWRGGKSPPQCAPTSSPILLPGRAIRFVSTGLRLGSP